MSRVEPRLYIFYEDSRGPTNDFGLHRLVEACVADDLNGVQVPMEGRPLRGNRNVIRDGLRPERIGRRGQPVVLLLDWDDAHSATNVPRALSPDQVAEEIRSRCEHREQLHVWFLEQNQETVIGAAAECDPSIVRELLERALRKHMDARDIILKRAAQNAATRRCIRNAVPSFDKFICGLAKLLQRTTHDG